MATCFFVFVLEVLLLLHTASALTQSLVRKLNLDPGHHLQCLPAT